MRSSSKPMSETPLPDPAASRGARSNRTILAGVVLLPIFAALAAVLVWGVTSSDEEKRTPETHEFVVPRGTSARLAVGQEVVVLPSKLEFRVGDKIVIRNEDHVDHPVGPYFVRAGEEFSITFGAPGKFEGYCPVSEGKRYDIEVTA